MLKKPGRGTVLFACVIIGATITGCSKGGDSGVTGAGAGSTTASNPPPKVDLSTPKAGATAFAKALENGDLEAAKAASIADEKGVQILELLVPVMGSMKKFSDAATAKFGEEGKKISGENAEGLNIAKQIEEAEIKETGDTATLATKNSKEPLKMKKVDGEWKVDIASMDTGGAAADIEKAKPMFTAMAKAAAEETQAINEGKYKTADEAKQAFAMKLMAAMFSNMPKDAMNPGAGGGMGAPGAGAGAGKPGSGP
jgi:hypothetical protein